ncbi:MAG: PAS domain S-box protein, partial [Candidatus Portnoybacteria bacterium]|nr:PAS domain S-box protein [Candidatus Portnoybacteria bacterium]
MKEQIKHKKGIRKKIILIISSSAFINLIVGVSLGYYFGFQLLKNTIAQNHLQMAENLKSSINKIFNEEENDLHIYLTLASRIKTIESANLEYLTMNSESIEEYFRNMDQLWTKPTQDNQLIINNFLNQPYNQRMKEITKADEAASEILITDKLGGLVMASNKTRDFYQADEAWWVQGFNSGKGKTFIGDIEYDESIKSIGLPFVIPIKNTSGQVIGVSKTMLDIDNLFKPIKEFSIGKTGHAFLINEKGNVLYHKNIPAMTKKIKKDKGWSKIIKDGTAWNIIDRPLGHKRKMLIACSAIKNPLFIDQNIEWKACIGQDTDEVLAPLNDLIIQLIALSLLLILLILALGNFFSKIFTKPIAKLHEATDIVAQGNLDYKVEINTNDEIEQFADSFNIMVKKLKETTASVDDLNKEIRERERAEEELRRSQEKYKNLFDRSLDAIMLLEPEGNFIDGNPAAINLFGCKDKKEFLMRSPHDLSPKNQPDGQLSLKKAKEMIDEALNSGSNFFEWTHKKIDGEEFPATVLLSKITIENKNIILATVRDITNQKRAEETLRNAVEMKSKFTSMVSHELRTPLGPIKEGVSIILDGITGEINPQQRDLLTTVRNNADRLNRLINNVLDFQKLESGRMPFNIEENDIEEVLNEAYKTMSLAAKNKNIKFELDVGSNIPKINCDRDKILQVLINLLTNAIKFTDKGSVKLQVDKDDND